MSCDTPASIYIYSVTLSAADALAGAPVVYLDGRQRRIVWMACNIVASFALYTDQRRAFIIQGVFLPTNVVCPCSLEIPQNTNSTELKLQADTGGLSISIFLGVEES